MICYDPFGCKDVFSTDESFIIKHILQNHNIIEIVAKAKELGIEKYWLRTKLSVVRQLVNISKVKRGNHKK